MGTGASPSHNDVSTPGRSAVLWGASLGIAFAAGLGLLALVNQPPPERTAEAAGTAVLVLILATPHLIALTALIAPMIIRGPLLLAAALLVLLSMGVSLAGVGIVFLPSAVLFGIAAVRTLWRGGWAKGATPLLVILVLRLSALFPYSFTRLYAGAGEVRCWESTRYRDGRVEWSESMLSGQTLTTTFPSGETTSDVIGEGGFCTSDIVTTQEATESLGVWTLGIVGLALVWTAGSLQQRRARSREP